LFEVVEFVLFCTHNLIKLSQFPVEYFEMEYIFKFMQ